MKIFEKLRISYLPSPDLIKLMKTMNLKLKEIKSPDIRIQWLRELDAHRKICRPSNFVIDENEIFCDKCYRNLIKFCPFCGSTRILEFKFHQECSVCKSMFYKKFL
jgi:hypothetical protein